ncbi:MAG TPA: phosphatase PAP2 family protein [Candidatus Megaira endosymbiont of Hartmannula sinica]|nr:phosphatase PAP2 family protein [Candidatus Megaera endosymbiont of Hartmannula sinica]
MTKGRKLFSIILLFSTINNLSYISNIYANSTSSLRKYGDIGQFINPMIALGIASQERGAIHFLRVYTTGMIPVHSLKFLGAVTRANIAKRPVTNPDKKEKFDGFPSGHTASAFSAASYIRVFSDDYKILSIPLYVNAAVVGYSRVKAKRHTWAQVIAGAVLTEINSEINKRLNWNKDYKSTEVIWGMDKNTGKSRYGLGIKFKL